jgi:hypothetical protein
MPTCEYCGKEFYAGDGAWDNSDYMCGECIADHLEKTGQLDDTGPSDEPPGKPAK